MIRDRFAGLSVRQILGLKKASVRNARLPAGTPSWDEIADMTWEEIDSAARASRTGFKTIRKLLSDSRFDR
jgi:hypothetical protein